MNTNTKVDIMCIKHGIFKQTPKMHMRGQGCPECGRLKKIKGKTKPLTTFIEESKEIYGGKYDYSLVKYKNNKTKVKIICPIHGIFEQTPIEHIKSKGCKKCIGYYKDTKLFIEESKEIHGEKYDYSLVEYNNNKTKVKIICKEHGIFEQTPSDHLNKHGCIICRNVYLSKIKTKDNNKFISDAINIHGEKYDYSKVNYISCFSDVEIICKEHGLFKQKPREHLNGHGCSKCNESKGERYIRMFLENKNINYIQQKTFEKCKEKRLLKFDFFLPDYNICIEYDGIQHFKPVVYFGGEVAFKSQKSRDNKKTNYCINNNIKLIRVPYNINIDNFLNKTL